jgi:hypothetical protein
VSAEIRRTDPTTAGATMAAFSPSSSSSSGLLSVELEPPELTTQTGANWFPERDLNIRSTNRKTNLTNSDVCQKVAQKSLLLHGEEGSIGITHTL